MEIYKILTGIETAKREWSSAVSYNARPKVLVHQLSRGGTNKYIFFSIECVTKLKLATKHCDC